MNDEIKSFLASDELVASGHKHRLHQRDLVVNLFILFSEEYDRSAAQSILDVEIPIERITKYLREKHGIAYQRNLWVYTQLRHYEEETGVKLFRKVSGGRDTHSFSLAIHQPFTTYFQEQHLWVNQKLKVANGVYEKIGNYAREERRGRPLELLLGSGTTLSLLAGILAKKSWEDDVHYLVTTYNLGCLKQLIDPCVDHRKLEVFIPQGRADPVTYTILDEDTTRYASRSYDFIIQGACCVCDGRLYLESPAGKKREEAILNNCTGKKLLVLTKYEFCEAPPKNGEAYGHLADYDCIVVPKRNCEPLVKKRYEVLFEEQCRNFPPEIISWNYEILKVQK